MGPFKQNHFDNDKSLATAIHRISAFWKEALKKPHVLPKNVSFLFLARTQKLKYFGKVEEKNIT